MADVSQNAASEDAEPERQAMDLLAEPRDEPNDAPPAAQAIIQAPETGRVSTVWNVVGASVQGRGHIRAGQPCQDYHDYRSLAGGTLIAAIADGLGSADKAGEGARIAVGAALSAVETALSTGSPGDERSWEETVRQGFVGARSALEESAETGGHPLRDYATTLMVAVIRGDWLAIGHIGDGAIVASFEDGTISTVGLPRNGEYANEVQPLTAPDAMESASFATHADRVQAVAMLSDGLQQIALVGADHLPFEPFFRPIFASLPHVADCYASSHELASFLDSERVCARTDDDKTFLLAGRKSSPESKAATS